MRYLLLLVLALAVSGCQTQNETGGEVSASAAGQTSGTTKNHKWFYSGQLKDGKPHGQGTMRLAHLVSGQTFLIIKGQFRNGVPDGALKCTFVPIGKSGPCKFDGFRRIELSHLWVTKRDIAQLEAWEKKQNAG